MIKETKTTEEQSQIIRRTIIKFTCDICNLEFSERYIANRHEADIHAIIDTKSLGATTYDYNENLCQSDSVMYFNTAESGTLWLSCQSEYNNASYTDWWKGPGWYATEKGYENIHGDTEETISLVSIYKLHDDLIARLKDTIDKIRAARVLM